MQVANDITELVGRTPLVQLNRISRSDKCVAQILLKLEGMNPTSSVKDRVGINMVNVAEQEGLITPGKTVLIEATSGNTGIALAMVAAVKGYKLILTMPDTIDWGHRAMLHAYGAQLELTPGIQGMSGSIRRAQELVEIIPHAYMLQQFNNPANPEIHQLTTAEEIWSDTDGKVDFIVAGVGTGGTITGIGEALKQHKPDCKVIAVEPDSSAVLSCGTPGGHKIQGIGAGFIPEILKVNLIDEVIPVSDSDAYLYARRIACEEGIFSGISTGAVLWAAIQIAKRKENEGKTIVVIQSSCGERYLSNPQGWLSWESFEN